MKKTIFALACCAVATFFTGCVSYTGVIMPGDDAVDEGNRPYALKAAQDYAQRQKFKRPVVIQEAEGMNLFLSPRYVPRSNNPRANELCRNIEVRRTMAQSAKAALREVVHGLRDLQLTGDTPQPMVSIQADNQAVQSNVYRITYNIANLDLQIRALPSYSSHKKHKKEPEEVHYEWVANASIEVQMIAPDGKIAFNFNAMGTACQSDDGSMRPNPTMLEEAAVEGIKRAMKKYAVKFGPVLYVAETCQNGEFVRIQAGTNYGIKAGMKVKFFRHRMVQGLTGQMEAAETLVGTGTVGAAGAPLEENSAWIHVDGYDPEVPRNVFKWTSVRLIQGYGSTGNLQLPGLSDFGL